MSTQIQQLAKKFIEGEWLYNPIDKSLKKNFSNDKELADLNLIDEDGYLNKKLKNAIEKELGESVLANIKGAFGDKDIFSGDIFNDVTQYNLELHKVSEETLDALQKHPNITIKIID